MVALLDDVAVLHHQNDVRLADGREAMGDNEARAALHQAVEGLLDLDLRARVDGGRRLVEDEHRRQAEHDARNAQQLLLPLGQAAAILGDRRVIALRQAANEAVRMRGLCRGDDLLVRCVRLAHDDILADGAGLEPGVLQHHAVGRAQAAARQLADILAAHADAAAVHIVEAHEQIDDRRLAAAGRADDGNTLAGLRGKIKMLDQVLLRDIGERDVLQRDAAVGVRERLRIGGLRGLRRFLDKLEDAVGAGQRILQLRYHAGNFVEGLRILVGIAEEACQLADGDAAVHGAERARHADARIDERVDKARGRIRDGREENGAQRALAQPLVDLVKAALCAFLIAEGLHDLLIADHLVDDAGLLAAGGGLLLEHGVGLAGDKARNEQRHRRDDHDDERDERIHPQHEQQRADDGEHARKELREAHEQAVCELVDIRDHAADDLAVAVRIDVAQGKDLQPRKGIAADIAHGAVGDAVVAGVHDPLRQRRCADEDAHFEQQTGDGGKLHLPRRDDEVDGLPDEDRQIQRHGHGQRGKQQRQDQQQPVFFQIAQQLAHGIFLFHAFCASFGNWE